MLPNHAPLVVAEQFGMLEALHPGSHRSRNRPRSGHRPGHRVALRASAGPLSADDFPEQLGELLAFFRRHWPATIRTRRSRPSPGSATGRRCGCSARADTAHRSPGCWVCPSPSLITSAPRTRCPRWRCTATRSARAHLSEPYAMIAASVLAPTPTSTRTISPGRAGCRSCACATGRPGPFPTPEEAAAYPYTTAERAFIDDRLTRRSSAAPKRCGSRSTNSLAPRRSTS